MLDSFYVARKIDDGVVLHATLHPNYGQEWREMIQHVLKQQTDIIAYQYGQDVEWSFRFERDKYYIVVSNKGRTIEYRGFWLRGELIAYAEGEIT